jgi:O-antigen/teichoic acid export membrane protein
MGDESIGRVRRNAVYLFLGVVVANLSSFLFRVIIAREFGPDGFGVFSLALMTASIATMVALLGLPDGMVTFVSKFREQDDYEQVAGVVFSSITLSMGVAITFSVGVILLAPLLATQIFNAPALTDVLWWFSWIIPANVAIDLSAAYFLGAERGGFNTLIKQVIPKMSLLFLVVLIAVLDGPLVAVGMAYLVSTVIAALFGLIAVGLSFPSSRTNGISIDLRELLTYSFPLLTTTAIGFLLNWTDTIVVGYFLESTKVGLYQSAFLLGVNINIVLGAISGSLYPNFSSLFASNNMDSIRQKFTEGTRCAIVISAAPAVYLMGFSELSLSMLFGDSFRTGAQALIILVAGQGLNLLFGPSTNLLKAALESRYVAITYGIAAILNLVLNLTLVPVFGLIGAAFATVAAGFLGNYLHFHRAQHHVDIYLPIDPLFRSLSAGLIAFLPSVFLERYINSLPAFGIHIVVFSALYVIMLFTVRGIRKGEIRSFLSTIS